jgi:hypothetical protein
MQVTTLVEKRTKSQEMERKQSQKVGGQQETTRYKDARWLP